MVLLFFVYVCRRLRISYNSPKYIGILTLVSVYVNSGSHLKKVETFASYEELGITFLRTNF